MLNVRGERIYIGVKQGGSGQSEDPVEVGSPRVPCTNSPMKKRPVKAKQTS